MSHSHESCHTFTNLVTFTHSPVHQPKEDVGSKLFYVILYSKLQFQKVHSPLQEDSKMPFQVILPSSYGYVILTGTASGNFPIPFLDLSWSWRSMKFSIKVYYSALSLSKIDCFVTYWDAVIVLGHCHLVDIPICRSN